MKIHCPHCGVKGSADDSYHGRNVKCPKCQKIFVASEVVAVEPEWDMADEPALSVLAGEEVLAESLTDLRDEDNILDELGMLAADENLAEESVAEENIEEETSAEEILEEETLVGEIPVEATDAEYEESGVADAVDADTVADVTDREPVLDWSDIVAEIDSQSAKDQTREKKDSDSAPADFGSIFGYDEKPTEDLAGTEIVEAAGGAEDNERLPDLEEPPVAIPPAEADRQEPPVEPVKAEEKPESLFIFEDHGSEEQTVQEVERQPYGLVKEQCWQCGKKDSAGVPFIARDGRLYCPDCVPVEELSTEREDLDFTDQSGGGPLPAKGAAPAGRPIEGPRYRFTIGGVFREAWAKTTDAKGAIWAGSAVMYLALLILVACGAFLLPMSGESASADTTVIGVVGDILFQAVTNAVSMLFTAGLLFMGVRKVAGDPVSWRMVFAGFPVAGKIIVVAILQSIFVLVGVLLLVLPGIYLAIGYAMTLPLIIDRGMSPWQAMEASRKAIHKVWWKVAGLFFVMGLIFLVSIVPLGIGAIWTWPMFFILSGVVYRHLFGSKKKVG